MFFSKYPYEQIHEMNLDWLIKMVGKLKKRIEVLETKVQALEEWKTNVVDPFIESLGDITEWRGTIQNWKDNIVDPFIESITGRMSQAEDDIDALEAALDGKQDTLTAGTGITIVDDVISATGGGGASDWDDISNKPFESIGTGLDVDQDGVLSVDGSSIDISNNTSITNIEDDIQDIIDGTTAIDISNNSSITNIEGDIQNIIDGTTPIDITNNSSITNIEGDIQDIIDGTTSIDITNNTSITNIQDDIDDIVDGTTPIDISNNSTITNIENHMISKETYFNSNFTFYAPEVGGEPAYPNLTGNMIALQSFGDGIICQITCGATSAELPYELSIGQYWTAVLDDADALAFMDGKSFGGTVLLETAQFGTSWSLFNNVYDLGSITISKMASEIGGDDKIYVHLTFGPFDTADIDAWYQSTSSAQLLIREAIGRPFVFKTYDFGQ